MTKFNPHLQLDKGKRYELALSNLVSADNIIEVVTDPSRAGLSNLGDIGCPMKESSENYSTKL